MCVSKVHTHTPPVLGKKGVILCCILGGVLSPKLQPPPQVCWLSVASRVTNGFPHLPDCGNPVLLTLFLDFMVNHKLILQPENARKGILVLFSISELCSPADTGDTLKRGEQKISSSGPSLSLTWGQVSTSRAVIRIDFPSLFALLFSPLLPL